MHIKLFKLCVEAISADSQIVPSFASPSPIRQKTLPDSFLIFLAKAMGVTFLLTAIGCLVGFSVGGLLAIFRKTKSKTYYQKLNKDYETMIKNNYYEIQ